MNLDDYEGHTPAPWEITEYIDHIVVSETKSNEVNGVDAALIAAAPDLLKEVKRFEQVKKWVYAHKKYPTITKIHLKDLMDIIEGGAA